MSVVISVENVSKTYRLGLIGTGTLHADLTRWWYRLRGKPDPLLRIGQEDHGGRDGQMIWALRDVSFQVEQGEVLGIIGRNGAGKSTLLKILSQVTAPTSGEIKVRGRVASLLEVGTGFHPELTGRENIYLNGAILGMTKPEVSRKLDEIVAFAEVEKFADTPVKRYSSGMYVRLAFAVAAHLEPEILVVDEVLAVGDAAFQSKCLGKMGDVARGGRTVLFVSHNMGSVTQLCERAIWLSAGNVALDGPPPSVVLRYLSHMSGSGRVWRRTAEPARPTSAHITSARVLLPQYPDIEAMPFDRPFSIEVDYELSRPVQGLVIYARVRDAMGNVVFTSSDVDSTEWRGRQRPAGAYRSTCQVPACILRPGRYFCTFGANANGPKTQVLDTLENILDFELSTDGYRFISGRLGIITPLLKWDVSPLKGEQLGERSVPAHL